MSPIRTRQFWDERCRRTVAPEAPLTLIRMHCARMTIETFVSNQAGFRVLYVFVVRLGSRRILHWDVTAHPTAGWTLHQFREAIPSDHGYRFSSMIVTRSSRRKLTHLQVFWLKILRTPVQAPKANAYCDRLMGTTRRE